MIVFISQHFVLNDLFEFTISPMVCASSLVHQCVLPSFPPQCVYQRLATVKPGYNESAVISTKFSLTLQVESQDRNVTLCR